MAKDTENLIYYSESSEPPLSNRVLAFLYFQSFTSKNCLKVKPLLQNVNFAKVVNFEPIFRGEEVEIGKI